MASDSERIVNLIQNKEKFTFSFEVTPDVSKEEIDNLEVEPAFFAVTWHSKSHQCKGLDIAPLETACYLRSKKKQVMLHLSCDLLKKNYLENVLAFLQEKGICNLFIVLGEGYEPAASDFKNTLELLKYIREISGSYFCIGMAGFCEANEEKLLQLKEKIDAGADFIITQAFFEADVFIQFLENCSRIGINVPTIPGVFSFENYKQLINFTNMCKVKVSDDVLEYVKKNDEDNIASVEVIKKLVKTLRSECPDIDFHFFTLNKLQNVSNIIKQIHD